MAKRIICAGNWKMYKSPPEAEAFLRDFRRYVDVDFHPDFLIFLPAINLLVAKEILADTAVGWGAQNCYFESQGAFTGENSPLVLKEIGASHCLVGHSERRSLFGETNEQCAKKVSAVQRQGLIPLLCVGESLSQREANETNRVIVEQLEQGLHDVDWEKPIWLAYEPVWAIGTGKVATPEQAGEAHSVLRKALIAMVGERHARTIPILYGGSVKPDNSQTIGAQPDVDGFLVGGASLVLESFVEIYLNARSIQAKIKIPRDQVLP
ncbi:MAG: triose-phosphate isomerase [Bdellovibrionales bacterium]|nr:triose-phosphate isomerase [Bdellovibrionales bacterium]